MAEESVGITSIKVVAGMLAVFMVAGVAITVALIAALSNVAEVAVDRAADTVEDWRILVSYEADYDDDIGMDQRTFEIRPETQIARLSIDVNADQENLGRIRVVITQPDGTSMYDSGIVESLSADWSPTAVGEYTVQFQTAAYSGTARMSGLALD